MLILMNSLMKESILSNSNLLSFFLFMQKKMCRDKSLNLHANILHQFLCLFQYMCACVYITTKQQAS